MKAIMMMFDSLNRHFLPQLRLHMDCYAWFSKTCGKNADI